MTWSRLEKKSIVPATQRLKPFTLQVVPPGIFTWREPALSRDSPKQLVRSPFEVIAPRESSKGSQQALDTASKAIKVYSSRYEPYPYTEFDIVSTPTLAFGIEYPGMIAITSRIYDVDQDAGGTPVQAIWNQPLRTKQVISGFITW